MTPREEILAKCQEVVAKARTLYNMDLSRVQVGFDLRGRCAGHAQKRGLRYSVRFNNDMLTREAFAHVCNETVPHEYAHIICFMNPKLGNNHDFGWAQVCRALGGSGKTRHSEEIVYGKGRTYEYTTDRGNKVRMSERNHRRVQGGETLRYRKNLGNVTAACSYSIVGMHGKTLAAPVVKQPVTSVIPPAVVVKQPEVKHATPPLAGTSKASISRRIMSVGYANGKTYEQIIVEMMSACGYNRQLARATYKANCAKVGVPETF